MALENAPGHPAYSGTFIPELWSLNILVKFYAACVLYDIANTDYEPEIKKHGDIIHVRQTPDVTIRDYVKGGTTVMEDLDADVVDLTIDRGKYFFFKIDDVDKYQSDLDLMSDWADEAAQRMKITIDTDVLGTVYGQAHASNQGLTAGAINSDIVLGTTAAPLTITKANVLDVLVDYGTVLDEQNVPETDRWLVIPPWMAGMIKKSELKDASLSGDGSSLLRNGRLGMIDRFTLYSSNLLTKVSGTTKLIFGHRSAISFASQITELNHFPQLENTFGQAIRGLNVYGFNTMKPEALGTSSVVKG